jgi:hypothetical protein
MISRGFVSFAVVTAILVAALPAAADPAGHPDTRLRASIDRALDAPAPPVALRAKSSKVRKAQSGGTSNGSGGGGGGRMILALLGTAISLGATYFIVKEMQKQPEPAPAFR